MNLPKHMPALDGLRAAAVTLVIASHVFPMVYELPWTVKRFSNLGWFGVQLFFVVSCITLANSWRRQELTGPPSLRGFALRRVFRIAPAYFLAAFGYAWLMRPGDIDATRVMTFLTFTSGWTPAQMPTVQNAWAGVPGGWSIEAEFAFYAVFPILIVTLRGLWRALAALAISLPFAWAANSVGLAAYEPIYGAVATDQFLYYWLPNQFPVFLCGLVTYELIVNFSPGGLWQRAGRSAARLSPLIAGLSLVIFALLAIVPWPRLPAPGHAFLPSHVIAAIAFSGATVALALRPGTVIANRLVAQLGQASFSAYLIHFAVIAGFERLLPSWTFTQTGVPAALTGGVLFLVILIVTGVIAQATYRLIEMPAIRLGARVIGRPTHRAVTAI